MTSFAATISDLIIDRIDLRDVKQLGFADADKIARRVIGLFQEGAFDVCTLFYSEFKSVISQIPTAQQIIPAKARREG
jgi:F-type H+-transporting ATPase subunit gamma